MKDLPFSRQKIVALHYAAVVLLASLTLTLLASVTLTVYLASHKTMGPASSLLSSIAGAVVAVLVAYYFGRVQKHRTETQVNRLRAHEKEFFQRLDKEIKSILAKAP